MPNLDFLTKLNPPMGLITIGLLLLIIGLLFVIIRKASKSNSMEKKIDDLYSNIKEQIQYSVAPKFIDISMGVNEFIDLAVEVWRIEQRIGKTIATIPEGQAKGLENSIQKLKRYLEKYDLEIIDYKNQKFNEGLNLDVLSVEKDPSINESLIKETIEPTIMLKGQVVRKAKVIVLSK